MKLKFNYKRRNPIVYFYYILSNIFCKFLYTNNEVGKLKNILLVNPNHIGDVIISCQLVKCIKNSKPDIKISFLVGSWAAEIVKHTKHVNNIHVFDHFHSNRNNSFFLKKFFYYLTSIKPLLKELNLMRYDHIFVLNSFDPSLILVLRFLNNTNIIGFDSMAYSNLLDLSINIQDKQLTEFNIQALLFKKWINPNFFKYSNDLFLLTKYKKFSKFSKRKFILIFPFSGDPSREWNLNKWIVIFNRFKVFNFDIYIMGAGDIEHRKSKIFTTDEKVFNLVNNCSVSEYFYLVKKSEFIITVESSALQLAAVYKKPTFLLSQILESNKRWIPNNSNLFHLNYLKFNRSFFFYNKLQYFAIFRKFFLNKIDPDLVATFLIDLKQNEKYLIS